MVVTLEMSDVTGKRNDTTPQPTNYIPLHSTFVSSSNITSTSNTNRWNASYVSASLFSFSFFSLLQFVVIASTLTSSGLKYDEYIFPNWSNILGWGVAMSSMVFVPLYAIYKFFSVPGTFKEVSIKTCLSYRVKTTTI